MFWQRFTTDLIFSKPAIIFKSNKTREDKLRPKSVLLSNKIYIYFIKTTNIDLEYIQLWAFIFVYRCVLDQLWLFDFLKIVWYYNKQSKHSLNWCIWLPSSKILYNIKVENSGKGVHHNDSGKEDHLDHVYKVVLNIKVSQVNIWIKVFSLFCFKVT